MKRPARLLCAALGLTLTTGAGAAGMKIKPGLWEFSSNSMTPGPAGTTSTTNQECISDSTLDPHKLMDQSQGCAISDVKAGGSKMTWHVECSSPAGQMAGDAEFRSSGDTAEGSMSMNISFGGNTMSFTTNWQGKRLGPC